MTDENASSKKGQIPTNLRLLLLLEEVGRMGVPVSPSKLADALKLPKPTVHRLLATAEAEGFLQRDVDGRSFGPGYRLRKLAASTLSSQRVRTERLIIMNALAEEVGETCNLAAPGRYGMVYLDRVETHWPLQIKLPVGTQVPFHCTASGKMYLSSLRADKLTRLLGGLKLERYTRRTLTKQEALRRQLIEIAKRGYSSDNEEFMDGMVAIAVPIKDSEGRLLTTLSIHAPRQRHTVASLAEDLAGLLEASRRMSDLIREEDA